MVLLRYKLIICLLFLFSFCFILSARKNRVFDSTKYVNVKYQHRAKVAMNKFSSADSINLTKGSIIFDLGNDTTLCPGDSLFLDVGIPGLQYFWSTGETDQLIKVGRRGLYSVTVSDGSNIGYDSILVQYYSTGKEGNIWYFGENAGLDFINGAPVPLLDGQLDNLEGCASMSDENGNLLFYTNGMTVWDRTHQVMQNGNGLAGFPSSAQSGIIVKKPGSLNIYYIFTIAYMYNPFVGLSYSEVNMDLNSGNGAVTSNKNIFLYTPTCERIVAVKHSNRKYYWIITKKFDSDQFYTFLIDSNGVNTTPVISNQGSIMNSWGFVVASPDSRKIATSDRYVGYEIFDFDNATGIISNAIQLGHGNESYGISFSPNSKLLYACNINSGDIYQWNIYAGSAADIVNSFTTIGVANGSGQYFGGALQIGRDSRIYVCQFLETSLGVINNPNNIGLACNFQIDAIDLAGRESKLGLPNFVYLFYFPSFNYQNQCFKDTTFFTFKSDTSEIDSVLWNFDDPQSGYNNNSNLFNPTHFFSSPGDYDVKLYTYRHCLPDSVSEIIKIYPSYNDTISQFICQGDSLLIGGEYQTVSGMYGDTLSTLYGCDSILNVDLTVYDNYYFQTVISICDGDSVLIFGQYQKTNGIYYDSLTTAYGCDSVFAVNLTVHDSYNFQTNLSICDGDSVLIFGQYQKTDGLYYDSLLTVHGCDSINTINLTIRNNYNLQTDVAICDGDSVFLEGHYQSIAGIYYDTLFTIYNCDSVVTTNLTVTLLPNIYLGADTSLCKGEYLLLDATTANADYQWQDNSTDSVLIVDQQGNYWVKVTVNNCSNYDTINVSFLPVSVVNLGADTTICSGHYLLLDATALNATYLWQDYSTEPTLLASENGEYWVIVTEDKCSASDTIYISVEECEVVLEMPNAISPNDDGYNDVFRPIVMENVIQANLIIFNRWGRKLFDSSNLMEGWDGKHNGKKCSEGVYFWIVKYKGINRKDYQQSGSVTVFW